MKIQSLLYILLILVNINDSVVASTTGDSKGNGGDVVICKESSGTSYEALDYYELKKLYQFSPKIFANTNGIEFSLDLMIQRLRKSGEHRADLYQTRVNNFFDEVIYVNQDLGDIQDSGNFETPAHCEIRQIINQNPRILGQGKQYVINKPLWDLIDNDSKVALIFHEIIYRELNHKTSEQVRKFNAYLLADRLKDFDEYSYLQFLKDLGFEYGSYQGVSINLNAPVSYYSNGQLMSALAENRSKFQFEDNEYYLQAGKIYFYENGAIKKFCPMRKTPFKQSILGINGYCMQSADQFDESGYISFYDNGQVASFYSMDDIKKDNWIIYAGKTSPLLRFFEKITFHPNGALNTISNSMGQIIINNQKVLIDRDTISFFENGTLKSMTALTSFDVIHNMGIVKLHNKIEFGPQGEIRKGISATDQILIRNGIPTSFEMGEEIEL